MNPTEGLKQEQFGIAPSQHLNLSSKQQQWETPLGAVRGQTPSYFESKIWGLKPWGKLTMGKQELGFFLTH